MTKLFKRSLVWFRRDLRSYDHAALYHALKQSEQCYCCFIFDHSILLSLPSDDKRVQFIYQSIVELRQALREMGGELIVRYGDPLNEIPSLCQELEIDAVFTNKDYEPNAKLRDEVVKARLAREHRQFSSYKDQVIFEEDEVLSLSNKAFSVFTPYKNAWLKKLASETEGGPDFYFKPYPITRYQASLASFEDRELPSLNSMGFDELDEDDPSQLKLKGGMSAASDLIEDFQNRIDRYADTRDFPSIKGPSYLSVHLRFGTISIRYLVSLAVRQTRIAAQNLGASVWLSELVWRDFYFMILHHHPHVVERAFKPEYDTIQWEQGPAAEALFQAWCEARTGYPLVDAAMLQLNQTGYMHNRLRMVVASFLIKDLGIDWRWGERYFALKLNDFDLAANNGGWQWAASSGCDAQPYFRIFNPITQSEKFDSEGKFIRRYLPQLAQLNAKHIHAPWTAPPLALAAANLTLGRNYPLPIVQHDLARQKTLQRYSVVKKVSSE
ncbi:deoxyribodipyrimidine photo-lyase [Undibacterium cyanobacteriorum]|uniref:Deoxyribodipyrimidine photo-lyase n=1 Tax=Undibacterium cyanobacteriorum TaxID=3073561 RepID=A0ABY9RDZ1_9BURK|nr:deoxyribodipyrimidine photo-lyase [Undibacterium sp. 20NA77.5]WMW79445.1 deoxyribodipyrimidine photo-lyase [Undibacterium sp. 20NA77.5]